MRRSHRRSQPATATCATASHLPCRCRPTLSRLPSGRSTSSRAGRPRAQRRAHADSAAGSGHAQPGPEARQCARADARHCAALEDYFGLPYPYPKLDQIASPEMSGAMNAGAIVYADRFLLLGDDAPPAQLRAFYQIGAHEIAHHWFGRSRHSAMVGRHLAQRILRHVDGRQDRKPAATRSNARHDDHQRRAGRDGDRLHQRRAPDPPADRRQHADRKRVRRITYAKGGGVLSMIESYVGRSLPSRRATAPRAPSARHGHRRRVLCRHGGRGERSGHYRSLQIVRGAARPAARYRAAAPREGACDHAITICAGRLDH